jgi:hypothetical protein
LHQRASDHVREAAFNLPEIESSDEDQQDAGPEGRSENGTVKFFIE